MVAAYYYLSKGIPVYQPLVRQGPHDFVICRDGIFLAVQVKTAQFDRYLSVSTLSSTHTKAYKERVRDYDLLFVVDPRSEVMWEIPVDQIFKTKIYLHRFNECRVDYTSD